MERSTPIATPLPRAAGQGGEACVLAPGEKTSRRRLLSGGVAASLLADEGTRMPHHPMREIPRTKLKHHLATFGSASKKPVAPIEAHFSENKTYSTAEDSHAATHNSFFAAHYQNQYPADEDVREMSDNDTTDVWSGAAVSVAWGELPSAYERRFLEAQPVIPESSREEQISLVLVEEEVPPPRLARRASQLSRSLTSPAKRIHMLGGEEPDFSRDSDDTTRVSGRSLTALADERAAWVHSQQHAPSRQEDNCSEDENAAGDAVDMEEYDDDMPGALPAGFLPAPQRDRVDSSTVFRMSLDE